MGRSEAEQQVCKKHPCHNQRQGVCPSCLRERLSQLYGIASGNNKYISLSCSSSVSSSPPYFSTSSSSLKHEALARHHGLRRNGSEILGSLSFRLSAGNALKKSRSSSVGFASRNFAGEVKNGKKKNGFWSKLLHLKGKKEVLMRSSATLKKTFY